MKKAFLAGAVMAIVFAMLPAHAASIDVRIVGFNYTPSGHLIVGVPTSGPSQDVATSDAPSISAGTSLAFANLDAVPHTVTRFAGPACNAACVQSGKTNTWPAFTVNGINGSHTLSTSSLVAGTYTYQCTIHQQMRGSFIIH